MKCSLLNMFDRLLGDLPLQHCNGCGQARFDSNLGRSRAHRCGGTWQFIVSRERLVLLRLLLGSGARAAVA